MKHDADRHGFLGKEFDDGKDYDDTPHVMYCLYCGVHATTPDDYPYCSAQCGIDAELEQ